jgi:hypothetical protein
MPARVPFSGLSRTPGLPDVPLVAAENAMERLFELEPAAPCRDHDSPVLFPGWRKFVAEVGYCKRCGEVVEIRLRA